MDYEAVFTEQLDGLHEAGNYRVFAELERQCGSFPRAKRWTDAFEVVMGELDAYGAGLLDKPLVVALSKIDTVDAKTATKLQKKLAKASGAEVMLLSAASGDGVDAVLDRLLAAIGPKETAVAPKADANIDEPWSPV